MDKNANTHNSDRLPLSAPSIQLNSKSHLNRLQLCLDQKISTNESDQLRSSIRIPDAEAMAKLIRQSTRLPTNGDRELVAMVANRVCPLEEDVQIPSNRQREFAWENFDSLVFNR
ncbi:hypothetical protein M3Y94_01123400 [Aphelenchoides besseyi]|nr:hypothetical protein M3Y94_01123400 [Aphelenchoides besseyi]KAI6219276.1 hypothetical protein M3Y95_01122200 [Aphelenchoides besseyi]